MYANSDVETYLDGGTSTPILANATIGGIILRDGSGAIGINRNPYNGNSVSDSNLQRFQINAPSTGLDFLDFQSYDSNGTYTGSVYLNGGQVQIGSTDSTPYDNTSGNAIALGDGLISSAQSGGNAAIFNRMTSDGSIVGFRKDGTEVGSIGNISTRMYIGSGDTGIYFDSIRNQVQPNNPSTGSNIDATIDLGRDVFRFKDLYLSGGAYLGGTGSANYLDDYEEGTWTPTYVANTGLSSVTGITSASGSYVKVGNLVHIAASFTLNGSSSNSISPGDNIRISGQPFQSGMTWQSQPGTVYTTEAFTNSGGTNGACYRYSTYYVVQFLGQGNTSWSGNEASEVYIAQTFTI